MAAVRDPAFWKRFSVAVHNDEQAKEARQQRPELKHSYVNPISSPSAAPASPAKETFGSPASPTRALSPLRINEKHFSVRVSEQPLSPTSLASPTSFASPTSPKALQQWPSLTSPKLARQPSKLTKSPPPAFTPRIPTPAFSTRHANPSSMTLGLSGRPPSRFKFWTSITANERPRDSWLEAQLKKKRQRTWICWLFWLVFFALVAGVVIVILLLRAKGII